MDMMTTTSSGIPTGRLYNTPDPKKTPLSTYAIPFVILIMQVLSVAVMTNVMLTLTSRLALAVPYALILQVLFGGICSLIFTRRALSSYAVAVVAQTPGGWAAGAVLLIISLVLWKLQPVLIHSGYTPTQAITMSVVAPLMFSLTTQIFSAQLLSRVLSNQWMRLVMDAAMRQDTLLHYIEQTELLQRLLIDIDEMTRGTAVRSEIVPYFEEPTLQAEMMTALLIRLCSRQASYMSPVYTQLLSSTKDTIQRRFPFAQQRQLTDNRVSDIGQPMADANAMLQMQAWEAANIIRRHDEMRQAEQRYTTTHLPAVGLPHEQGLSDDERARNLRAHVRDSLQGGGRSET